MGLSFENDPHNGEGAGQLPTSSPPCQGRPEDASLEVIVVIGQSFHFMQCPPEMVSLQALSFCRWFLDPSFLPSPLLHFA